MGDKLREFFKRLHFLFVPSDTYQLGYDSGYKKGLDDGGDFGKRIAYNVTLKNELNGVLGRYSRLQLKLLEKKASKSQMQDAYNDFLNRELDHFKMELQDR